MFDPTAFDNMKVVLEGALYDRDIFGEIVITDRNDLMNMAKMSRYFDVSFKLPESKGNAVSAKIMVESKLINLAAELLQGSLSESQSGCQIKLQFYLEGISMQENFQSIERILLDIWGETRKITLSIQYYPLDKAKKIKYVVTVDFDRLISEDQMDDLVEMTEFMITTIQHLQSFVE